VSRIYLTLLVIFIMTSSCEYFVRNEGQNPVAKVNNKYLYESDLIDLVPQHATPGDSAVIVNKYIDNWIRKELMLQKAEGNLSDRERNFEKQIADYRSSLIIFKYQQQLLSQKLDTFVSNRMILDYYEENASNFLLDKNIIRGMFIKVPRGAPNIDKIKTWARNEEDTPLLESYGYQFAVSYDYFDDDWIYFEKLISEIPSDISDDENFLRNNRTIEVYDSVYYYFAGIKEYKLKGSIAPVSIVRDNIRSIILNKRKIDFLLELEKNIYNEALSKNLFEVY
jgi:hypothetical protein